MALRVGRVCEKCCSYVKFIRQISDHKVTQNSQSTNGYSDEAETHFGFQTLSEKEKAEKVNSVFSNVATKYDMMNDVMSGGVHRLWKDEFINHLNPIPGTKLLDVAGGTGDIAFRFLQQLESRKHRDEVISNIENPYCIEKSKETCREITNSSSHVVVCDINSAMLSVGKAKAIKNGFTTGISWVQGDAECLPFDNQSFDACTIAFGIRNTVHIEKVLSEVFRVLKIGGRFLCLEFSHVKNPLFNWLYNVYSFEVIPVMGQIVARDWKSYQYLVESIQKFPEQELFCCKMEDAGFKLVTYKNLMFGVAAIHSGFKL